MGQFLKMNTDNVDEDVEDIVGTLENNTNFEEEDINDSRSSAGQYMDVA